MIKPYQFQCPVCCSLCQKQQAFSIGNCNHYFCQSCCVQHIKARLQLFQQIKCLDNTCNQKLTKQSKIYQLLSSTTKRKIQKYQQFKIIQSNQNLKPCLNEQCLGIINISQNERRGGPNRFRIKCEFCQLQHCIKCFSIHPQQQNCKIINQQNQERQQKLMKGLHYRRCPNCNIWVQKNGGCQYLKCKCSTQFCFSCGSRFQNDPCRKLHNIKQQQQIRKMFKISQYFFKPQTSGQWLCLIPKSILKLLLVLLFTIISGIFFMTIAFGLIIPLVYLIAPAGLIIIYSELDLKPRTTLILRILTVLLYPLVGLAAALVIFFLFLTYPFMRVLYNSHLYDEMDKFMNHVVTTYLNGIKCVLSI